jgi:hypothetical protein
MNINIIAKITGFALFIVSCIFSVNLMVQFAVSGLDRIVWSVMAVSYMSAMMISSVLAIRLILHRKHAAAAVFIAFYVALYFVSLFGTLGFESASSHDAAKIAGSSDEKKKLIENTLSNLDKELESCEKQAEAFSAKGYISKGLIPLNQRIERVKAERQAVYQELKDYKPVGNGAAAFWGELAKFTGSDDPDRTRFLCFFTIACLLDLCAAMCFCVGVKTFQRFITTEPTEQEYFGTGGNPDPDPEPVKPLTNVERLRNQARNQTPEPETRFNPEPITAKNSLEIRDSEPVKAFDTYRPDKVVAGFNRSYRTVQYGTSTDTVPDTVPDTLNGIDDYVRTLFSKRGSDGALLGRRSAADRMHISNKQADNFHDILKRKGLIRVEGQKTFPNFEPDEILRRIR